MQYFGVPCCKASILLHWTQNDVWHCFIAFRLPSARKQIQNLCFGPECTISSTEVVKHPFYSIRPKMMFRIVSEHFVNIRRVKRCKTCVSGLNALFWGTEVAKHLFYCIGPKMMFGSVSEHFANVRHIKDAKLVFQA
jgi:hypothetical protein